MKKPELRNIIREELQSKITESLVETTTGKTYSCFPDTPAGPNGGGGACGSTCHNTPNEEGACGATCGCFQHPIGGTRPSLTNPDSNPDLTKHLKVNYAKFKRIKK